jgi:hypothetical protein
MRDAAVFPGDAAQQGSRRGGIALLLVLALVDFVAHMLVSINYGYFRDVLYPIEAGRHLAFGYVDFPPLIALVARVLDVLAGDVLWAIHVVTAVASSLIVFMTGLMARELGGGRFTQALAAVASLAAVGFLATGSLFSMDALDELWWVLASYVLILILKRNDARLWLLFGLIAGVGLTTKVTMLFFGSYGSLSGTTNAAAAQSEQGVFPQLLGDRFGWNGMVKTVGKVYDELPAGERSRACIFTGNYGEASAFDFLGGRRGLPPAISGHNTYYLWGPEGCTGEVLITVGLSREEVEGGYASVRRAATIACRYCMPEEDGAPVYVATGPKAPIQRLWPRTRHYE